MIRVGLAVHCARITPGSDKDMYARRLIREGKVGYDIRRLFKDRFGHNISLHKIMCIRNNKVSNCIECDERFYPANKGAVYCGMSCRDESHSKRMQGRNKGLIQTGTLAARMDYS